MCSAMRARISLKRRNGQLDAYDPRRWQGHRERSCRFQSLRIGVGIEACDSAPKNLMECYSRKISIPEHWWNWLSLPRERRPLGGQAEGPLNASPDCSTAPCDDPALEGTQVFHDDKHCHVAQARACSQRPSDLSQFSTLGGRGCVVRRYVVSGLIRPENCAAQIEK